MDLLPRHVLVNLYIDFLTGFFTCVKCRSSGEWTALQRLFYSAKSKEFKDKLSELKSPLNGIRPYPKELTIKETLTAIHSKSDEEICRLMQQFNMPVSSNN